MILNKIEFYKKIYDGLIQSNLKEDFNKKKINIYFIKFFGISFLLLKMEV